MKRNQFKSPFFRIVIGLVLLISLHNGLQAQQKSSPAGVPKFRITLGGYPGGNITSDILKSIVDSPLVVRDEKGNRYLITHFRVNYYFKSQYKDEASGQTKTMQDFRAYDFYDKDRMSEDWRGSIRDNVKKDDEMLIDLITVRLKNGKKMMTPDLRFKVIN